MIPQLRALRGAAVLSAAAAAAWFAEPAPAPRQRRADLFFALGNLPEMGEEFERRTRPFRKGKPRPWRTWKGCQRRGGR